MLAPRLASAFDAHAGRVAYTVPSLDERATFAENSVKYEATLRFINGSMKTMMDAMKSPSQG